METYETFSDWLKRQMDTLDQIMEQYNVSLSEAILILTERNRNDKTD